MQKKKKIAVTVLLCLGMFLSNTGFAYEGSHELNMEEDDTQLKSSIIESLKDKGYTIDSDMIKEVERIYESIAIRERCA